MSTWVERPNEFATLDYADNEPGAIEKLQELNEFYRMNRWPAEYASTSHQIYCADARDLSSVLDESVHLVVTSPPYWTLKEYAPHEKQLGAIEDYEQFLAELDKVWAECARVLVPGGRICWRRVYSQKKSGTAPRNSAARGYYGAKSQAGTRFAYPDFVVQNRKWSYRGRGQRCRVLRQAVSTWGDREK